MMEKLRCAKCGSLLVMYEIEEGTIDIKCRCGDVYIVECHENVCEIFYKYLK